MCASKRAPFALSYVFENIKFTVLCPVESVFSRTRINAPLNYSFISGKATKIIDWFLSTHHPLFRPDLSLSHFPFLFFQLLQAIRFFSIESILLDYLLSNCELILKMLINS